MIYRYENTGVPADSYYLSFKENNQMKKLISFILAAVMCVGCIALLPACGSDDDTLIMATNAAFPPYEFVDGSDYAGIDIEIAQAIATKLGKKLKIEDVDFGAVITGVQSKKYDFGMAGLTVTEERKEKVNFSTSYATGVQVIIVKTGSAITGLDSIFNFDDNGDPISLKNTDIKVGVQQDTTGDIYCSDDITNWGFNNCTEDGTITTDRVVRYKTGADAIEALKTDKIDLVIIDNEPAKSYVSSNSGAIFILENEEYVVEDYAICVNKDNAQLLADINKALEELKADGTISTIINKYIKAN